MIHRGGCFCLSCQQPVLVSHKFKLLYSTGPQGPGELNPDAPKDHVHAIKHVDCEHPTAGAMQ